MNLGEIIEALERVPNKNLSVVISPFDLNPTGFDSYRGYYNELAICYDASDNNMTVAQFIILAQACNGSVFTGYKGGSYIMGLHTRVWVSNYGRCSYRIVKKVKVTDFAVYIKTENGQ